MNSIETQEALTEHS